MECVHDEEDSDYGSDWAGFSLTHLRPETFLQNLLSYGGETSIKNGMTHAFVKGTVSSSCAVERSPALALAVACFTLRNLAPFTHIASRFAVANSSQIIHTELPCASSPP